MSMKLWFPFLFALLTLTAQAEFNYQGLWWVAHGDGAPLQIRLYPDGRAWSDYPANNPGKWRVEGDTMICRWADDWKEVFVPSGKGFQKLGYRPGVSVEQPPSNQSKAYRACASPDGWFGPQPTGF